MKPYFVSMLCLFALLLPVGCTKGDEPQDMKAAKQAEVYIADDGILDLCIYNTDTLNPLMTSVKHNAEVISILYDRLFTIGTDFTATPGVCDAYKVSESGLTFTAQIRSGIFFQDKTKLTAEDVAASLNAILHSDGYYKKRLSMIKGAQAKGTAVEIYLTAPTENLERLLDFPILPADFANADDGMVLERVIPGSGLFCLDEYLTNQELRLSVNEEHFSGILPHFETAVIHMAQSLETAVSMLENGQIDILTSSAVKLDSYTPPANLKRARYPGCTLVFLGCSARMSNEMCDAISSIIDRTALSDEKNFTPAFSPIHPNADKNPYISSKNSTALFAAEGWQDSDGNGVLDKTTPKGKEELSLTLLCAKEASSRQIGDKLLRDFSHANIRLALETVTKDYFDLRISQSDYTLFLASVELLPNFDKDTISLLFPKAETEKKTPSVISLYFKDETLLYAEHLDVCGLTTLNPYLSIASFTET